MINTTTLSNGVRVIVESVANAGKTSLECSFGVGSQNEPRELNGLAHLTEHAFFLGTKNRSQKEIRNIENQLGITLNAETTQESTRFIADVLPEDLSTVLTVFADMIQNPAFPKDSLQKEKKIILTEIKEVQEDDENTADNLLYNASFKRNPLGLPTEGSVKTIKDITEQDVQDFYQRFFCPEDLIISVAGEVDFEPFAKQCERLFGQFEKGTAQPIVSPSPYLGGDRRIELAGETDLFRMGFQSVPLKDVRSFAVAEICSDILEENLFEEIRENKGLLYAIHADNWFHGQNSVLCVSASCESQKTQTVLHEVCTVLNHFEQKITPEQVEIAKKRIKLDFVANKETLADKAESNCFDLRYFGKIVSAKEFYHVLETVTAQEVVQTMQQMLSSRLSFAGIGYTRKMPSYDQLNQWLRGKEAQTRVKQQSAFPVCQFKKVNVKE